MLRWFERSLPRTFPQLDVLGVLCLRAPRVTQNYLLDEDDQNKSYTVSENLVVMLEGARLTRGEEVYAVYPDTTSFYPAVVTSAPRRSASAAAGPIHCTVQFHDDADENGYNPDKQILLHHVIRPPEEPDPDM